MIYDEWLMIYESLKHHRTVYRATRMSLERKQIEASTTLASKEAIFGHLKAG